jgi:hypothetical protein
MVLEGTKTLPVVYRKVSEEIRSNRSIYGKSGRVRKIMEGTGKYQDNLGYPRKSRGFQNRCIHVALWGKEFPLKADFNLVKKFNF